MTVQDQLNSVITNFNNLLKTMTENFNFLSITKANNSDVVHKTGDETVAGTKTFNNTIVGSVNGNANTATNDIDGNPIKTTYQKVSNLLQVINESTTKYPSCNAVKTAIDAKDSLPSQTGNAGKFLTTDGSIASWKNSYTPPLLSCMWSDHLLSDMSWLRADTFSWQDGNTYSLAYNELLSEYNNSASTTEAEGSITFKRTPKGYKIALETQETAILNKYNSDGIAWYYIIDTTNQRFKLPRTKWGFKGLRDNVGDDIAESLPNIKAEANGFGSWGSATTYTDAFKDSSSSYQGNLSDGHASFYRNVLSLDASLVSSAYQDGAHVQEKGTQVYTYFYVGEWNKTAVENTAGIKAELFNGKVDLNFDNMNPSQTAKNTIVGWGMPDFSTTVDIPTTLDLVQCCDKDCYLSLFSYRVGYGFIQICDVEGNAIYTNLSEANYHLGGGTVPGTGFAIMTPLLPKGTYFKFVQNSGLSSAKKIYKRG